jgi:ABC-2 type transport system permease protein
VYIAFWLGVAILFSILCRNVATSALAALAVWLFFSFFVSLGASVIADAIVAETTEPSGVIRQAKIARTLSHISPMELYTSGTLTILDPMRRTTRAFIQLGMLEKLSLERFSGPLPLGQSVLVVAPYLITLVAMTVLCFAVSYTVFMRQEIRSI